MKACIFDMDGTLFDTETIFQAMWKELAEEMGVTLPKDFKYKICGTSGEAMNQVICQYYGVKDGKYIEKECKTRVANLLSKQVPLKKGCKEILETLYDEGYQLAIASSSPMALIERNLEQTKLRNFFHALTSGEEVEKGKPAPDIFLLAAKKLSVEPKDCYVFEDSPNGIKASHAAGMKPILVPDLMPVTGDLKEISFLIKDSLEEVIPYFKGEN